ncbi:helix-turn-helix domain-containing protein [Actinoplanes aureus]|uniref:Helix-turn-helix transcriptional regulator n=1 Tax=Actinoplanes aureus TaxID=2792083 RepID=A0A931CJE5_9ACTN|nr:helix-turn-helix transcriptional regulator [Actinoplanes aureus]MBG0567273.1 helix-turn-helix transcriptional regulator [Actinoplanes aureus]
MPKITLSERERELIALLAEGHTDAGAAERLGISPRSVTNILRSLMDRLGVANRFQLGLALGFLRRSHTPKAPSDPAVTEQTAGSAVASTEIRP